MSPGQHEHLRVRYEREIILYPQRSGIIVAQWSPIRDDFLELDQLDWALLTTVWGRGQTDV